MRTRHCTTPSVQQMKLPARDPPTYSIYTRDSRHFRETFNVRSVTKIYWTEKRHTMQLGPTSPAKNVYANFVLFLRLFSS